MSVLVRWEWLIEEANEVCVSFFVIAAGRTPARNTRRRHYRHRPPSAPPQRASLSLGAAVHKSLAAQLTTKEAALTLTVPHVMSSKPLRSYS